MAILGKLNQRVDRCIRVSCGISADITIAILGKLNQRAGQVCSGFLRHFCGHHNRYPWQAQPTCRQVCSGFLRHLLRTSQWLSLASSTNVPTGVFGFPAALLRTSQSLSLASSTNVPDRCVRVSCGTSADITIAILGKLNQRVDRCVRVSCGTSADSHNSYPWQAQPTCRQVCSGFLRHFCGHHNSYPWQAQPTCRQVYSGFLRHLCGQSNSYPWQAQPTCRQVCSGFLRHFCGQSQSLFKISFFSIFFLIRFVFSIYSGIHQSGMKSFSMGCLRLLVVEHVHDGRFADRHNLIVGHGAFLFTLSKAFYGTPQVGSLYHHGLHFTLFYATPFIQRDECDLAFKPFVGKLLVVFKKLADFPFGHGLDFVFTGS